MVPTEEEIARRHPSLRSVAQVVAWAFTYAPADQPLNGSHPLWKPFLTRSEWFRTAILQQLSLSLDTKWDDICRIAGFLVTSEYESEEQFRKAYRFGETTKVRCAGAPKMFEELEQVKFQIVGRI